MKRHPADLKQAVRALRGPLALGFIVLVVAAASIALTRGAGRVAIVWPVNGLVLAWLLQVAPARWPALLVAAVAGNAAANLLIGDPAPKAALLALSNSLEVTICGLWLRRFVRSDIDFGRPAQLGHFLIASVLGAGASTLLATAGLSIGGEWSWEPAVTWFAADMLGLAIVTPLALGFAGATAGSLRRELVSWRGAAALAAIGGSFAILLGDPVVPPFFIIPPVLVFIAFILDAAGLAIAITIVTVALVVGATYGLGASAAPHADLAARLMHAQALLAVATLSALLVRAAISERRRAEARLIETVADLERARDLIQRGEALYRRVAENASDIIARTTIEGAMLYLSPSVQTVTGYAADDLLGNTPAFLPHLHPDDLKTIRAFYRQLLASDRHTPETPLTYRLRHRDGRWIWLESRPSILRDPQGRPLEIVDVVRDVTARTELEAALVTARREAEEAATVKSRFIANMSHEIRSPLMAVIGFTDRLAKRQDLSADALSTVWKIEAAGRGLLAIANDVLDFSKLEAGSFSIRPHPCDVTQLCLDTRAIYEAEAHAKGLALDVAVEGLPEFLMLDGDRLRQILTNFVSNAIKFTETGQVTVRARHRQGRLRLEVRDTGPGISRADQDRLFLRFSQIDGGLARRHGGTGLGLAISRGLAEAMGGSVGVVSKMGCGATFFADLPAEPPDRAERSPARAAPRSPEQLPPTAA